MKWYKFSNQISEELKEKLINIKSFTDNFYDIEEIEGLFDRSPLDPEIQEILLQNKYINEPYSNHTKYTLAGRLALNQGITDETAERLISFVDTSDKKLIFLLASNAFISENIQDVIFDDFCNDEKDVEIIEQLIKQHENLSEYVQIGFAKYFTYDQYRDIEQGDTGYEVDYQYYINQYRDIEQSDPGYEEDYQYYINQSFFRMAESVELCEEAQEILLKKHENVAVSLSNNEFITPEIQKQLLEMYPNNNSIKYNLAKKSFLLRRNTNTSIFKRRCPNKPCLQFKYLSNCTRQHYKIRTRKSNS